MSIPQRKGDPIVVDTDEGVRPGTTAESLGSLRPAFSKDGTITAGNASQISDGGAAVIVTSRAKAEELGVTPLAELIGYGMVAGPDPSLLHQPSRAIKRALEPSDLSVTDIDLFELNEAFAAVGIASMRDLGINDDDRQRERRRDRARPPGRHVGRTRRAHDHQRAAPPRWRHRRRRALRWWRPGRRRARPHPLARTSLGRA